MFITSLRSSGYDVVRAKDVFGERTDDRELLQYCADEDHVFVTNDVSDFGGVVGDEVDHAGLVVATDPDYLGNQPEDAVRTLERILEQYPREELRGDRIWIDRWRDGQ